MSGPPPKPTKLRILEGNPAHRPLNKDEPQPPEGAPVRAGWLITEAKREWKRVTRELESMGLLSTADRAAIELYCQHYARWKQSEIVIREKGLIFKTPNGLLQRRPEVNIAMQEAQIIRGFLCEFGLTPASRSRISLPNAKTEDVLDAILRGAS